MQEIYIVIISSICGSFFGGLVSLIMRSWLSEKIKQSIQYEYSQRMELLKEKFSSNQLRVSLFFEHQRDVFTKIITQLFKIKEKWGKAAFEPDVGFLDVPVPYEEYEEFISLINESQLFLDSACSISIDLAVESMQESFPFVDGDGTKISRCCSNAYGKLEFLIPRIANIFRSKIGVDDSDKSIKEICLYSSMRLLNEYHFKEIDLPMSGDLKITRKDTELEFIQRAKENEKLLISKLTQFRDYLLKEGGCYHKAALTATRCLEILNQSAQ